MQVADVITLEQATAAYACACESMSRLNLPGAWLPRSSAPACPLPPLTPPRHAVVTAARLMHKYGAHGATDVTGFGFLGHARNLAEHQAAAVAFELHTLPVIAGVARVDAALGHNFRVVGGLSAETSGGLLVALRPESAAAFVEEYSALSGKPSWIVGRVVEGDRSARIVDGASVVEV